MRIYIRLRQFATRHRVWTAIGIFVLILTIAAATLVTSFRIRHRNDPLIWGVSFSTKYARELGLDWREAYQALLNEADFDKVRLMSYWDLHEPARGEYDFSVLDEQFELAQAAGTQVSLAIGLRQPRWPECHQPDWTGDLSQQERREKLLVYLTEVVNRYRNHPALASYQLENEVANRSFGDCPGFDRSFLKRELALVQDLDPKHPVIINVSNQSGVPLFGPLTDKVGFSVYRHAHFEFAGQQRQWSFWYLPPAWHSLRASLVELRGTTTFIHELQAEPWGPRPTLKLSLKDQDELMSAGLLKKQVDDALATGMHELHLWGGEYWYWRRVAQGDDSLWQQVRDITNNY